MISFPVLKQDFKINARLLLIIYGMQFFCLLLAAGIRNMRLIEISDIFWDTIPVVVIPLCMVVVLSYNLVSRCEEEKTMDFILATEITPKKVIWTKSIFLVLNVLLLTVFSVGIGCAGKIYDLTGIWEQNTYLWLNAGGFCLQIFWCGYCMLISCVKKRGTKYVYWKAGALIPLVFYVIYLLYYLIPELYFLEYVTIFSLFQQQDFVQFNIMNLLISLLFLAGGGLLFGVAGQVFCKRYPQR